MIPPTPVLSIRGRLAAHDSLWAALFFPCFLMVHSPDGHELWLDVDAVSAVQPVTRHQDHIVIGTNTVVYTAAQKFGVRETDAAVLKLIKDCRD